MKYQVGQLLYTSRNPAGFAIKGELTVSVMGYNKRYNLYMIQFTKCDSFSVLPEGCLRDESFSTRSERRERKQYDKLHEKYGKDKDAPL